MVMKLRNAIFTTVFSAWLANCACSCSDGTSAIVENDVNSWIKVENLGDVKADPWLSIINEIKEDTIKETSICLMQDENSHTYTWTLESIENPENTTLEFPVSHLFQKYWNRSHPLAVRWIKKDFRSLLWKDWIENLSAEIPQKLSHRSEKVTSDTQYELWDTIRFQLINPELKWVFPQYLSDQLKEEWFEDFSDIHSLAIEKRREEKKMKKTNQIRNNKTLEKTDFIYDVVVKRLPEWKAALALYRDWELFMATYVSVWLNSRKTRRWQFKTLWKNPYYYSHKYRSPMPYWVNFDEWWFWFHQWNVTWYPASHGCVRQPWIWASVLYSCVKNANPGDVFIDKNLYKQKK